MAYYGYKPAEQAIQIGDNTIVSADIADGSIVNADVNSSAAIAMSKTQLAAGTGITLSTNTLNVDAAQTQITSVGTIGTGTWQGTKVASAYLDDDTAHLSTTQTFSGAKTFSSKILVDNDAAEHLTLKRDSSHWWDIQVGSNGNLNIQKNGAADTIIIDGSGNSAFAGQMWGINGSASAPTYAFVNDGDTGMWKPASNQLALGTGGTQALIFGGDQSATFASTISMTANHASNANGGLHLKSTANHNWYIHPNSDGNLALNYNNSTTGILLDASGDATFAGITTVHKAGANSELIVKSDSSTYWTSLVLNTNSSTNNYIVSDSSIVHFNSARTSTGASLSIDNANDRVGINEPSPAYNLEITEGTFAQTKSNNGHVSEYLGNFGVANGNKLIILINHPSGGYHHIQGTIKVVGACGGHAAARVSLIRHFLITSLSGYDETTSDVVQYDDVHSNVASGVTISALDNSDNISGGAGGTDDFEMSITNSTGHTNDNASYEVYYELFGQITGFTVSASV